MNVENFVVRPKRRLVENYSQAERGPSAAAIEPLAELAGQVAGLPSAVGTRTKRRNASTCSCSICNWPCCASSTL